MFHLSAEKEYVSAGFIHCSFSRAVLYHVQEILVYVRTSGFAGFKIEVYTFPCIFSNSGFDVHREDYLVV